MTGKLPCICTKGNKTLPEVLPILDIGPNCYILFSELLSMNSHCLGMICFEWNTGKINAKK